MPNKEFFSVSPALPSFVEQATTILESIDLQVSLKPDATALIFLADGEKEEPPLTYSQLSAQIDAFAAGLLLQLNHGDRAILLFQSSYEFVIAFFGCLRAGVIAVPMPIPSRRINEWIRIENVQKNCNAKITIAPTKILERLLDQIESIYKPDGLNLFRYEQILASCANTLYSFRTITQDNIAFLQYTSGSTGAPKGVALSHSNLIENQKLLYHGKQNYHECVYVSWLPLFHDMGLIGNLMQALYIGQPFIFMAPSAFLQKPVRWLRAISNYKARVSGAPNFAYQLCVDKIKTEDCVGLDLNTWKIAFNGAEPVRPKTIELFQQMFARYGFQESTMYPCYGTAESTLIISGAGWNEPPFYLNVDRDAYEANHVVLSDQLNSLRLVSSGTPLYPESVAIVDPHTCREMPQMTVGEIWVSTPCNASGGYWDNEAASRSAFANRVEGRDAYFLNTGDLGFIAGDQLFITGRSKDLLIFNGRNVYPQDIETCSEATSLELKPGRCAAFSIQHDDREKLVLVHEVERSSSRKLDGEAVIEKIRISVNREFSLSPHAVVLVAPSTIPMTSSGKIRRQTCKQQYLSNELKVMAYWSADEGFVNNLNEKVQHETA